MQKKIPSIAILATGHEIVEGDILNTNAYRFAYDLSMNGLNVVNHLSCRDIEAEILSALDFLSQHDIIITIGGLGPTVDDITRFIVAKYLKQELIEYPQAISHIQSCVTEMRPNQYLEALFPKKNTTLIPNGFGTAMGAFIQNQGQLIIMLPGPPRECLPMWEGYVLAYLSQNYPHQVPWRRFLLFGVAEASIALQIEACLDGAEYELSYRLAIPYLEVKIKAKNIDVIEATLKPLFAPLIIADKQQRASEALINFLETHDAQLSIEDKMTHGLLESILFTPKLAKKISFAAVLSHHFIFEGLDAYWQQETADTQSLIAKYQEVTEYYQTQLRSDYLRVLAAEWACGVILRNLFYSPIFIS